MCGITGFSLTPEDAKNLNATNLMRSLLYGIENRGKHATGVAFWQPEKERIHYNKNDVCATKFITSGQNVVHEDSPVAIAHTRHATQGLASNNWNNHPIMIDTVIGVHNGMIDNDYEIFREHTDLKRQAEVDSEVIFQLLAHECDRDGKAIDDKARIKTTIEALEAIRGSMAIAWLDSNNPQSLNLARGSASPIVIGWTESGSVIFASTKTAIEAAERSHDIKIEKYTDTPEGTLLCFDGATLLVMEDFTPNVRYRQASYSAWEDEFYGHGIYGGYRQVSNKPVLVERSDRKAYTDPQGHTWYPAANGGWTNIKPNDTDEATVDHLREEHPRPKLFLDELTPDCDELTLACIRGQWEPDRDDEQEKGDELFAILNDNYSFELVRWWLAYGLTKPGVTMSEKVFDCLYSDRNDAIMKFYTDPADGQARDPDSDLMHGYARPGDEIETSVDGETVRGSIVAMPQTYPEGAYVLTVQKSYRTRTGLKWEDQVVYRQWFGFSAVPVKQEEHADAEATSGT